MPGIVSHLPYSFSNVAERATNFSTWNETRVARRKIYQRKSLKYVDGSSVRGGTGVAPAPLRSLSPLTIAVLAHPFASGGAYFFGCLLDTELAFQ